MSLLVINSSFLAGHVSIHLFGSINPYILGGSEILLGLFYYVNKIIGDVRNVFDVEVKL